MGEPAAAEPVAAEPVAARDERDVLLATKLHMPRPHPDLVPRPRLAERLDEGLARGLMLVCAPAGYGKTVLLRSAFGAEPGAPHTAAVPGLIDPLTSRELEVLQMLAAGKSNQAIASELVVTLDTVKKHVSHVLGKLGAANRTGAVTRARELGLTP